MTLTALGRVVAELQICCYLVPGAQLADGDDCFYYQKLARKMAEMDFSDG